MGLKSQFLELKLYKAVSAYLKNGCMGANSAHL